MQQLIKNAILFYSLNFKGGFTLPRIDIELVNRNLIDTRAKAQEAIKNGIIYCNNKCITKNSYNVIDTDVLTIQGELLKYVSRGGLKLEKAINAFNIDMKNKTMCDIGSSTGGFSDCAIQNGVSKIYAIDVGSDQFDEKLRLLPNIRLFENTDFRNIDEKILEDVNIITIDVSFISVTKLISKIALLHNVNEIMCLVKPQFECGKDNADKYKGVILNKQIHCEVIEKLSSEFGKIGFNVQGLTSSPIKGGSGNIEYLMYLRNDRNCVDVNVRKIVSEAFGNVR